jgi:hypothetical protein
MSNDIMSTIVAILEDRFPEGGEPFFDALDDIICNDSNILERVYNLIKDPHRYTFVLTGTFGEKFVQLLNQTSKPYNGYLLFPGGMRSGVQQPIKYHLLKDPNLWVRKVCFVDDSFYSGTTRTTCLQRLSVPKDIDTFVAYDGSLAKEPFVKSLFRYHKEV